MALVLFGNGVADMRGSVAGNTFSRNRGGAYIRNRVVPLNPGSNPQNHIRQSVSNFAKAWGATLTAAQRAAWTAFAAAWPVTNKLGATIVLTGEQMYVRLNTVIYNAGGAAIADPPANLTVGSLLTLSGTFVVGASATAVFTATPLSAGDRLQIFATAPLQPGIGFVRNRLRYITTMADATASPSTFYTPYIARFGQPLVGQQVVIECRVLRYLTGAVSQFLRYNIIAS